MDCAATDDDLVAIILVLAVEMCGADEHGIGECLGEPPLGVGGQLPSAISITHTAALATAVAIASREGGPFGAAHGGAHKAG